MDKDVGDSEKERSTLDIQSMALPMSNHKILVKNSIAIVLDSLLEQEKGTAKEVTLKTLYQASVNTKYAKINHGCVLLSHWFL